MRIATTLAAVLSISALSLGLIAGASADDESTLTEAVAAFLRAETGDQRLLEGMNIAMRWSDAAEVAAALPKARTWSKDEPKEEVVLWKRKTSDGVEHTILANIPASYDATKPTPVFLWLHGGVSRDQDGGGASGIRGFADLSNDEGFILLSPSAQKGSEWWTPNGVDLVRGSLADLARKYNVDGNRVAVAGFSDGASGCYHLLAHDPEPYACFIPLMGHPGLTRLAGGPCFAANVKSRPVFAHNGGIDALYPSVRIKPLIGELKAAGCDIEWTDLPNAGHRMTDVFPEHWAKIRAFWQAHPRTSLPKQISWESAVPSLDGRFAWVEVTTVDAKAPSDPALKASILKDPAGRAVLGIQLDQTHREPGIKIGKVTEGSAAEEAGFEVGDLIVAVDGASLMDEQGFVTLRRALGLMHDRDGTFKVKRGEEELEIQCRPRVAKRNLENRPKELGYGLPAGRILAAVEDGNVIRVRTRHVTELKLHLAPGLVDLTKPVIVFVNGKERYKQRPEGSVRAVLEQALRAGPGAPLWQATITLKP